jgi:hypothetical protein
MHMIESLELLVFQLAASKNGLFDIGEWASSIQALPIFFAHYATVIALLGIALGLVLCFFGYRLFKIFLSLAMAAVGMVIGFLIVSFFDFNSTVEVLIIAGGALLFGVLSMLLYNIGIFVVGFLVGALLVFLQSPSTTSFTPHILVGILIGTIAVMLKRPVIIIITAINGAIMVSSALAYRLQFSLSLMHIDRMLGTVREQGSLRDTYEQLLHTGDGLTLILLVGTIVLAVIGIVVQSKTTKRRSS